MKHSIIVEIIGKTMIKTLGLILFFSLSQSKYLFMPNLPMGEYRLVYRKIYPCASTKNYSLQMNWHLSKKTYNVTKLKGNTTHLIPLNDTLSGEYRMVYNKIYPCASRKNYSLQMNWHLSKKTYNVTELKGNMTYFIPFDDTLTLDINVASWGSTGGWIPNSNIIKTKNACSSLKYYYGNAWITTMKGFNIPGDRCPLPTGTFITSGIDLKKLEDTKFNKVYFYGKYKVKIGFKNLQNKEVGCLIMEVDFIRPWETPI